MELLFKRPLNFRYRLTSVGMALLLLFAAALRLYNVNRFDLWLDEALQYSLATAPVGRILRGEMSTEWIFPPLLFTKLQIWLNHDINAGMLRLPYVIFGIATVGMIFLLAREMFDETIAWIASFFAAIWPRLVEYSQEMRPYALFALLVTVAGFALLRALRTNRTFYWVLGAAALTLQLYNHFNGMLNVLSFFIFTVVGSLFFPMTNEASEPQKTVGRLLARAKAACPAFVGMIVGLLVVLPSYWRFLHNPNIYGYGPLPLNSITLATIGQFLGFGSGFSLAMFWICVTIGFLYAFLWFRQAAFLAALWLFIPLVVAVLRDGGDRLPSSPRYVLFIIPALLPLFAAGIAASARTITKLASPFLPAPFHQNVLRNWGVAAAVAAFSFLIASSLVALYRTNPKQVPVDLRHMYAYVSQHATSDDVILGCGEPGLWPSGWFNYTAPYYFRRKASPAALKVIPIGSDPRRGEIPFGELDAASGKLFAMLVVRPETSAQVEQAANGAWLSRCWDKTCVVESVSDLPMRDRLDDFFRRFSFIDPASLTSLPESHHDMVPP